ncbi:WASH complex subunit strumpellin [Phytophthora cinnamomi]|uniref:WASH complex subunit strumpellin n=1 Tax=Phytophthora cinnamomi TaxID=4785 RepID=UPI003559ABF4|nr:WASH complex subunit strumpellin [Phytophthora cinnamomi]
MSDLKWATIPFEGDRLSPLEIAALAEKKLGKKMELEFIDYEENKKNFNTEHRAMYITLIEDGLAVGGTEEEAKSSVAKFYPGWNPTPYESFVVRSISVEQVKNGD